MIFPESFYGAKDDDIANDTADANRPSKRKQKCRVNVFGLFFNLCFSLAWLWLSYHFISRLNSVALNQYPLFYANIKQKTDIICMNCDLILSIYHLLYCVIPSLGVGEHDGWQTIIPTMAVLVQIIVLFYEKLLNDDHYSNYLWSAPVIMGSISIGILTSNDSDGKDTLLLYFKPWILEKVTESEAQVAEDHDIDAAQNSV